MKCMNCGGEVDSQAVRCPYCGGRNAAGISFYKEVYQKVNRNKLLAPVLLRQKTPELIQRMLTRIILAMGILGLIFIGIGFLLYLMIDDPVYRDIEPDPNSYAAECVKIYDNFNNNDFRNWTRHSNEFLDKWNCGGIIGSYEIELMLKYGFQVYYADGMDPQLQQQARMEVDALLEGILQLSEEELALFHKADEQSEYYVRPDPQAREQLQSLIEVKLADRADREFWNDLR